MKESFQISPDFIDFRFSKIKSLPFLSDWVTAIICIRFSAERKKERKKEWQLLFYPTKDHSAVKRSNWIVQDLLVWDIYDFSCRHVYSRTTKSTCLTWCTADRNPAFGVRQSAFCVLHSANYPCRSGKRNTAKSEWMIFLELVECTCREVEHRIHSSDSSVLQGFLFWLQANKTDCKRILGATVDYCTFLPNVWTGSTFNRWITQEGGPVNLVEEGDAVMRDIRDILTKKTVHQNIPPFLNKDRSSLYPCRLLNDLRFSTD